MMAEEKADQNTEQESQDTLVVTLAVKVLLQCSRNYSLSRKGLMQVGACVVVIREVVSHRTPRVLVHGCQKWYLKGYICEEQLGNSGSGFGKRVPYSGKFSLVQIIAEKHADSSEEIFAVFIFTDAGLSGHTPTS